MHRAGRAKSPGPLRVLAPSRRGLAVAIVVAMTCHRAFTLVEVVVAVVVVATAAAALATTLGADRRLRTDALATDAAARQVRERIESLAARCDSAPAEGTTHGPWLAERWRSVPAGDAWRLTDSLRGSRGRVMVAVEATVTCRP